MINNLIDEIEKMKTFRLDARNLAIKQILELLNQYNLIAAPKSVKLSEIVERLKDFNCYTPEIKIDKHEDATIIEVNYYTYTQCECGGYIQIIDRTICDISFGNHSYHKWLYELWIAGTEIVDDVEKLDNVKD